MSTVTVPRAAVGPAGAALAVLAAAALFSTTGTTRALLVEDASPSSVAAVRLLVGAAGMLAYVVWTGRGGETAALATRRSAWVMALGVAGYQVFFFEAVARTGVAVGTLVALGSAPLLSGLLGWAAREGAPGAAWAAATAVAVLGLALLSLGGGGRVDLLGVLFAFGAGASYAVYTVVGGRLARDGLPPSVVITAPFALGALLLVPLLADAGWVAASGEGLGAALWLGLATTAAAYLLFALALPVLQPGHIATLTLLEPVGATLLGVVVLHERLAATGWTGCGLVLAALVGLAAAEGRRRAEAREPAEVTS